MSEFTGFASVTQPAIELIKIELIMRRFDLLESLEYYEKVTLQGGDSRQFMPPLVARLRTLYQELKPAIRRKMPDYEDLDRKIENAHKDIKVLRDCIETLINFLDNIGLTRIDIVIPREKTKFGD